MLIAGRDDLTALSHSFGHYTFSPFFGRAINNANETQSIDDRGTHTMIVYVIMKSDAASQKSAFVRSPVSKYVKSVVATNNNNKKK